MYKCVLKHPFIQDGPTITIFLHRQFFTLPNRWTFVVTGIIGCSLNIYLQRWTEWIKILDSFLNCLDLRPALTLI